MSTLNSISISEDNSIFPIEIFPEWVKEYLISVCNALPCPIDFMGVFSLGLFSTIINNSRFIKIKNSWKESALLYLIIISEPSTKKSPALSKALFPLYDAQKIAREQHKEEMIEFRKKNAAGSNEPRPHMEKYFISDVTVEAAASILDKQDRGYLYVKDEAISWTKENNQYKKGGNDKAFWLSNWSNSPISIERKTSDSIAVDSPFIPFVGGIQPDLISGLNSVNRDGFINRILFSFPDKIKSHWTDTDIDETVKNIFSVRCQELFSLFRDSDSLDDKELDLSPEAKEQFKRFYNELADEIDKENNPLIEASLSKMQGYTARFSLIIQLLNHQQSTQVSERSVLHAISLSKYFIYHMRKTLSAISETDSVKIQLDAIEKIKAKGGTVTPRDLYRGGIKNCKNRGDAMKILKILESSGHGEIIHTTPKNGGRKSIKFTLFND